jgi:hypothetical protein
LSEAKTIWGRDGSVNAPSPTRSARAPSREGRGKILSGSK